MIYSSQTLYIAFLPNELQLAKITAKKRGFHRTVKKKFVYVPILTVWTSNIKDTQIQNIK